MRAQVELLPVLALSFSLTSCAAENPGTAASGGPAEPRNPTAADNRLPIVEGPPAAILRALVEPRNPTAADDSLPTLEKYVYVEELPEVVTRATPVLPEEALQRRAQGTVVVTALVGRDGLVKDARVTKSSPPFDAAAVSAVRQYIFKPAMARGKPVAVWVAVPIRFVRR